MVGAQFLSVFVSAWGLETYFLASASPKQAPPNRALTLTLLGGREVHAARAAEEVVVVDADPAHLLFVVLLVWLVELAAR